MLSTLALGFGFATTALAQETAMAPLKNLATEIEEHMKMSDALTSVDERRRFGIMTLDMMERYLGQHLCGNVHGAIRDMLKIVSKTLSNRGTDDLDLDSCDVLKSVILPHLRRCTFSGSLDFTLYAGFTYDGALVVKHARAVGAFVDNRGNEGCFDTNCYGAGVFVGATGGAVAGVLMGDGTGDFPGVAWGGEVGLTTPIGGFDLGGGFTTSGVPYAEVSVSTGAAGGGGVMRCSTDTDRASEGDWGWWGRRIEGAEEMEPLPRIEEEEEMEE